MLVYADVTDLVQQADRLKEMAAVDGMTGSSTGDTSYRSPKWSGADINAIGGRCRGQCSISISSNLSTISLAHATGDHVIVQIAEMCRHEERKSDVVARFGGEEFLLLLPETQMSEAHELAERLRRQVEARELSIASHAITATVSVGVAQATSSMNTIFDLIKVADQRLYTAKKTPVETVCACSDRELRSPNVFGLWPTAPHNRLTGKVFGAEDQ